MKRMFKGLVAAILAGIALPAAAAHVTILFNSFEPPTGVIPGIIRPWAREVAKVTDGRVTVTIPPTSLAPPPRQWELVTQGVADAAYVFNPFMQNKWVLPQMAGLPFLGVPDATARSTAIGLWRTYEKYFRKAHEYKQVHLLGFVAGTPVQFFSLNKPIVSLASLKDEKIFSPPQLAKAFAALGAVPVVGPVVKIHDQVSSGIVDMVGGVGYHSMKAFHAMSYVKSATDVPGGIALPTFSVFIGNHKWQSISKADRAAIMSISGARLGALSARWDKLARKVRQEFLHSGRAHFVASPQFVATARRKTEFVTADWLRQARARGVNGKAAIAYFKRQVKQLAAKP